MAGMFVLTVRVEGIHPHGLETIIANTCHQVLTRVIRSLWNSTPSLYMPCHAMSSPFAFSYTHSLLGKTACP